MEPLRVGGARVSQAWLATMAGLGMQSPGLWVRSMYVSLFSLVVHCTEQSGGEHAEHCTPYEDC